MQSVALYAGLSHRMHVYFQMYHKGPRLWDGIIESWIFLLIHFDCFSLWNGKIPLISGSTWMSLGGGTMEKSASPEQYMQALINSKWAAPVDFRRYYSRLFNRVVCSLRWNHWNVQSDFPYILLRLVSLIPPRSQTQSASAPEKFYILESKVCAPNPTNS